MNFEGDVPLHVPGETGRREPRDRNVRYIAPLLKAEPNPEMRALSIRQPWAEQILRGQKRIEYRTVACTNMIGKRIYLYASARYDEGELAAYKSMGLKRGYLVTGMIVGIMEIDACVGRKGNYKWFLKNPERLESPLKPINKPQPVWFRPFYIPEEG
jgi:hypothetical protein